MNDNPLGLSGSVCRALDRESKGCYSETDHQQSKVLYSLLSTGSIQEDRKLYLHD